MSKDMSHLHILLVEDTAEHADIILRSLEQTGSKPVVTWIRDGDDALDILMKEKSLAKLPDLILLDIKMPRVNGFEVLKNIKSDTILKVIPVVMLSTTTQQEEVVKSYQLGANSYIVKPIGFRELVDIMTFVKKYWGIINQKPYV